MKKYILIIGITALCIGKINSQVIVLVDTTLSGTQTGNNNYTAFDNIESTQIINSGKTTYTAGNEILLNPGFEVKLGAEFEATVDNSLHIKTMMTYNLNFPEFVIDHNRHAEVINRVKPDVVALQEVIGKANFNDLKTLTGMKGEKVWLLDRWTNGGWYKYGLVILWNPALGTPKKITKKWPQWVGSDYYRTVGYIIAEFEDFCFISTHYPNSTSTAAEDRVVMTQKILGVSVVQNCINSGKPIYIGGDFNEWCTHDAIQLFVSNGFEVLNPEALTYPTFDKQNTGTYSGPYSPGDFIIEYNTNPNHKTIEHGIPEFLFEEENENLRTASDHFPYFVKVKIK